MFDNRYAHMVQEYYVARLRELASARRARIDALRTRADAECYVRRVRRAVRRCFGPFPGRTPLNPVVVGRRAFKGYRLENIRFESRPRFLVTGNLYLPADVEDRRPCVLGLCGHAETGKAYDLYQRFCQGLALKGFVVFVIDPISQGERQQHRARDRRRDWNCCTAHNCIGNPMVLVDDFFGTWRLWDAMRALDYLLARPEVDPARVGVTGNSGGGTLSTYLTALDPRLTMAAPSCFVTSYLADLENELPSDSEQNPPGILRAGLDQVDMLLCYAPRPTLLLWQRFDFFDARAARQAADDMQRVHRLLGRPRSAVAFEGPRAHGFYLENREAMYGFFMQHAGVEGDPREKGVAVVDERELYAAPRGNILCAGSRPAYAFTAGTAEDLRRKRGNPTGHAVERVARRLLALPPASGPPHYRCLRESGGSGGAIRLRGQFAVETEPGIQVIVSVCGPASAAERPPQGHVCLYVGHRGGQEDAARVPQVRALTRKKIPLVVADPRGLGQSMPRTCGAGDFLSAYGSDYLYACAGEMLGESYLGRRVFDIMRTVDFLRASGATRVDLVGRGIGATIVAFAALLHRSRPRVRLIHYLPSFETLTRDPAPAWPLSAMLRGVLKHFDLPDVYRALGPRLTKGMAWGPRMRFPREAG